MLRIIIEVNYHIALATHFEKHAETGFWWKSDIFRNLSKLSEKA